MADSVLNLGATPRAGFTYSHAGDRAFVGGDVRLAAPTLTFFGTDSTVAFGPEVSFRGEDQIGSDVSRYSGVAGMHLIVAPGPFQILSFTLGVGAGVRGGTDARDPTEAIVRYRGGFEALIPATFYVGDAIVTPNLSAEYVGDYGFATRRAEHGFSISAGLTFVIE